MKGSEDLVKLIKELGGKGSPRVELAVVTDVNEANKTCDVQLLGNNLDVAGVRLTADVREEDDNFFLQVPLQGSSVVVMRLVDSFWLVIAFGDLEKVIIKNGVTELMIKNGEVAMKADAISLNGGDNGGLVKVESLTSVLRSVNAFLTGIKSVLSSPVVASAPGSPDAFHAALTVALANAQVPSLNNLENKKVKH